MIDRNPGIVDTHLYENNVCLYLDKGSYCTALIRRFPQHAIPLQAMKLLLINLNYKKLLRPNKDARISKSVATFFRIKLFN